MIVTTVLESTIKTELVHLLTVVHKSTRFRENRFKTFRVILFTKKQTNKRTNTSEHITFLLNAIS